MTRVTWEREKGMCREGSLLTLGEPLSPARTRSFLTVFFVLCFGLAQGFPGIWSLPSRLQTELKCEDEAPRLLSDSVSNEASTAYLQVISNSIPSHHFTSTRQVATRGHRPAFSDSLSSGAAIAEIAPSQAGQPLIMCKPQPLCTMQFFC